MEYAYDPDNVLAIIDEGSGSIYAHWEISNSSAVTLPCGLNARPCHFQQHKISTSRLKQVQFSILSIAKAKETAEMPASAITYHPV